MTDVVLVAQADGVLTLTLNRPDSLNALTVEVMGALADRLEAAAADRSARAVVITGAGSAFSAGGDLAFLQELPGMPPARAKEVVYGTFQRVPRLIRAMDKPVIAAVNGAAVGAGCEIAVACDFRIASEKARFGEVWITLGCIPALGGMYLLPRLVGLAKATELVLTGEIIDAREALRIGLVNRVVMPPDLPRAAEELARSLARGPARAIAAAKEALNRGLASTFSAELDATVDAQVMCFGTRDFAEGVRALTEKRPPRFTGE
ncbi:MAG: enoyl-CoA hydratase-related protein [candidate division NC10 bacterium]|mgnify:FL=1